MFTIPLVDRSSYRPINETRIAGQAWLGPLLRTVEQAYRKAPQFPAVMPLVEGVFRCGAETIDELAFTSLRVVADYLDLTTAFVRSTSRYGNADLKGQDRILDICCREGATTYVNAPGGRQLYVSKPFAAAGIALRFLRTLPHSYLQDAPVFVPRLSIIDVLMSNPRHEAMALLGCYELEL